MPCDRRSWLALKERQEQLTGQIQALGYAESDYLEARKRQATLKPLHDRFLSLSERVAQIPGLKERIKRQEQEIERLDLALKALHISQRDLGYNPQEYEALSKEKKDLGAAEKEAQKIRLMMAGEIEARERLAAALAALEKLNLDLNECRQHLFAPGIQPRGARKGESHAGERRGGAGRWPGRPFQSDK